MGEETVGERGGVGDSKIPSSKKVCLWRCLQWFSWGRWIKHGGGCVNACRCFTYRHHEGIVATKFFLRGVGKLVASCASIISFRSVHVAKPKKANFRPATMIPK